MQRQLHQFLHQLDLAVQAAQFVEGDLQGDVALETLRGCVEHHVGVLGDHPCVRLHLRDPKQRASNGMVKMQKQQRARSYRAALLNQFFLQMLLDVMRGRGGDIHRGLQPQLLHRSFALARELDARVQPCLQRLTLKAIEPDMPAAAVLVAGRINARQNLPLERGNAQQVARLQSVQLHDRRVQVH